ncbi:MAG: LON peptidase substrate-binding domain-containing protein [Spirochaeta sp.]|nr:LON peptidase substrate-binding domain-containing protein [Spirochaeta sp.]
MSSQDEQLIPLFPLPLVLFPYMPLPLHIFEPRYRDMIHSCMEEKRPFGLIRAGTQGTSSAGCLAEVRTVIQRFEDGRLDILSFGLQRFSVLSFDTSKEYLQAKVRPFRDATQDQFEIAAELRTIAIELFIKFAKLNGRKVSEPDLTKMPNEELSFMLCHGELFSLAEKQELLELRDTRLRIDRCTARLSDGVDQRVKLSRVEQHLKGPSIKELQRLLN